jgi:hypothetical protein
MTNRIRTRSNADKRSLKDRNGRSGGGQRSRQSRATPAAGIAVMQRMLGNATMSRLMRTADARQSQLLNRLAGEAERAGRTDLLERFGKLTPGQKAAVLKLMDQLADAAGLHSSTIDWGVFELCLAFVEDVPLKEEEAAVEADAAEEGGETAVGTVNTSGLLPPYDKVVRWLNYKAHKQGKAGIMSEFEGLDLDQKKLAIHRMADGKSKRADVESLKKALTVRIKEKEWLDWDKILEAIRGAKQVNLRDMDEKERKAMLEIDDEEHEPDIGLFAIPFLLPDKDDRKEEGRPIPVILAEDAERFAAMFQGAAAWEAIVDRCLGVPDDKEDGAREEERRNRLAARGFDSMEQCFKHIVDEWARLCFERGVLNGVDLFVRFIGLIGFKLVKGKYPLPSGIAARLLAMTLKPRKPK